MKQNKKKATSYRRQTKQRPREQKMSKKSNHQYFYFANKGPG